MTISSRIALGALQSDVDITPMLWALTGLLQREGYQSQLFQDRACFRSRDSGKLICGQSSRYLDPWLMSERLAKESFRYGCEDADFALVYGCYQQASATHPGLEVLCDWLDLAPLVVVDVSRLDMCRLGPRPPHGSALLLDRVSEADRGFWQTTLETLWAAPVLGTLPELGKLRSKLSNPCLCPAQSCELCAELASHLARTLHGRRFAELAARETSPSSPARLFRPTDKLAGLNVAVAFDEAFDEYFPEVLDLLELQGAKVRDFSPLRDPSLPAGTDVVYFGGGHPDRFAQRLSQNHCMLMALREHAARGRRLYAENGSLSYLCQQMVQPSGELLAMVGIFPAVAERVRQPSEPVPSEVVFERDHWLGRAGFTLRGYLNSQWRFHPTSPLQSCASGCHDGVPLVLMQGEAVGSRLDINFAAQPEFLGSFASAKAHAVL